MTTNMAVPHTTLMPPPMRVMPPPPPQTNEQDLFAMLKKIQKQQDQLVQDLQVQLKVTLEQVREQQKQVTEQTKQVQELKTQVTCLMAAVAQLMKREKEEEDDDVEEVGDSGLPPAERKSRRGAHLNQPKEEKKQK